MSADEPCSGAEGRPEELVRHNDAIRETSDELILGALVKLSDPKQRGNLKPSFPTLCKMTGLHENTIRMRPWAVEALKNLKSKQKEGPKPDDVSAVVEDHTPEAKIASLRSRVARLLNQNALFYETIIELKRIIARKDALLAAKAANPLTGPRASEKGPSNVRPLKPGL